MIIAIENTNAHKQIKTQTSHIHSNFRQLGYQVAEFHQAHIQQSHVPIYSISNQIKHTIQFIKTLVTTKVVVTFPYLLYDRTTLEKLNFSLSSKISICTHKPYNHNQDMSLEPLDNKETKGRLK